MKKTLITTALLALAVGAFAQGTINFGNNLGASTFRAAIYGPEPDGRELHGQTTGALSFPVGTTVYTAPRLDGARYKMELLIGSSIGGAMQSVLVADFLSGTSAGFITARPALAMPEGFRAGSRPVFEIRAWDSQTGSSWASALSRGTTGVFAPNVPLGGVDDTGNPVLVGNLTGWTSFNLVAVPEPSTIALGVLGVGTLLFLRRRKA